MKSLGLFFAAVGFVVSGHSQSAFSELAAAAGIQPIPGSQAIAVADFNADGWDDFYLSFASRKNQLYKNLGDGTFAEIAQSAGVDVGNNSTTAVWGDINNDGYPDLYVGRQDAPDQLFLNKGNETFQDITFPAGIIQVGRPFSVNMADVDNDGFLDIYVSNFLYENFLFRNNRNNTFTNSTFQARAFDSGKSMGTIFFDYDLDGDQDLYLVHDGFQPNFLYQNDGTGLFSEIGQSAGVNTKSFGMGVDAGDVDNDGYPDLYITNLYENILLRNKGDGSFEDISSSAGVQDYGMGWGLTFLDFDNDGFQDIYVANDYAFSFYPNVLYRNTGNLRFEKTDSTEAVCNKYDSYGTATLDFNSDGRTDLLVANKSADEQLQLFQNTGPNTNWIGLKLIGIQSNRDAIGAKIRLIDKLGRLQYRELRAGQGWQSQNSSVAHFGLGAADSIREISISWPSGLVQTLDPMAVNQFYRINEGGAIQAGLANQPSTATTFIGQKQNLDFRIFPNPAFNIPIYLQITLPKASALIIEFFDLSGREIYMEKVPPQPAGEFLFLLDPKIARPGAMLVRVSSQTATRVKRLVFMTE